MRMTRPQKVKTILGGFSARFDIKRLLVRRYWERHKTFMFDFEGIHAIFSTEDFYSNHWFYGPQSEGAIYEPGTTQVLLRCFQGCRGFADVGANLGYFSVIAGLVLKPFPVTAFEMDATLAPLIKRNLELNNCTNVQVVSAAVGDERAAEVSYTPHAFHFVNQVTGLNTEPFQIRLSATTVILDEHFAGASALPNFAKIDVDGAEMAVLRGMSRLLAQPDFRMLLEVHAHILPRFGSTAKAVLDFLYERGFKTFLIEQFRMGSAGGNLREIRDASEVTSGSGDMLLVTRNDHADIGP
jgi:FkbM family methyltransferase